MTERELEIIAIVKAAEETGHIVTAEEHSVIGGLGGAVAELLSERCPVPVLRHGVEDQFGRSGKASDVLNYYGFTPEVLAEKAKRILRA